VSRIVSIATAPWRLAKAVRRHGLGPITSFVVLSLRRYGVKGAIRLAVADRRAREERAEADIAADALKAGRSAGPPDLDKRFGLTAKAWTLWRPWVGAAPPHPDPYQESFEDAAVLFVIQLDEAQDADSLARTEAAVRRLPTAQMVVAQHGKTPDPPAGPTDRFVVVLKAGDVPAPDFAREIARAARGGVAEVISFDMVRRDADVVYPLLLPGANPTLLAEVDYLFSRVALRGEALGDVSSLSARGPRAQVLQWLAGRPASQVRGRWRHVGRPLVEVAVAVAADDILALREEALRAGRSPAAPPAGASVSVVICTKDKGHLLRQLVRSLLAHPPGLIAEIVIVANNTTNPYALQTLADLAETPGVIVARRDTPFNFSKLSNEGARSGVRGSHLLFLNDDIAPVSDDWLIRLLSRFNDPEVAAAGPLLLYPDERVQHGGMYLGFDERAGHTLRGAALPDEDYLFTGVAARETSCLTGAVLLVQRSAFDAINGFDEQLATYLQDVDLGLRLHRIGLRNVFDPSAVLIHMESASIRSLEARSAFHRQRAAEFARFQARWGASVKADRFHPAGFDLQDESLHRLSGARGVRPPMKDGVPLPAPR
jgi:GT2 family glycosyltransferase